MTAPATQPATLSDWFAAELEKKLAGLPNDDARRRLLKTQLHVWENFFDDFAIRGRQPYGGPHPVYGAMDAFDFRLLMSAIELRISRLERIAA